MRLWGSIVEDKMCNKISWHCVLKAYNLKTNLKVKICADNKAPLSKAEILHPCSPIPMSSFIWLTNRSQEPELGIHATFATPRIFREGMALTLSDQSPGCRRPGCRTRCRRCWGWGGGRGRWWPPPPPWTGPASPTPSPGPRRTQTSSGPCLAAQISGQKKKRDENVSVKIAYSYSGSGSIYRTSN